MSTPDSDETSFEPFAWQTNYSSLSGAWDDRFVYVPDSKICRRMFESWSFMVQKKSFCGLACTSNVYFNDYFGSSMTAERLRKYWPRVYNMNQLHCMVTTQPYESLPNGQKSTC